jgi:ABC-type multidrug transport system permease subunit
MPRSNPLSEVLAVAGNEFRQFRRNRTAIIISLVVLPLFFTVALGAGRGGAGTRFSSTSQVPIAFVDDDLSTASGQLWQTLINSGDFHHLVQGYREENAIAALGTGRLYAAIIVPQGFQGKLANNETATVILYVDDGQPRIADEIASTLRKHLRDFNLNPELKSAQRRGIAEIQTIEKGAFFSGFLTGLPIVLGVVQIFAAFYEIAGGMSKEREEGTYARLLLSSIGQGTVMLGKTLYDLILSTVRTLVVLGLAVFAFGARPHTDLGTLLAISLLLALVTAGFGFFVSSLGVGTRAIVIVEFFLVLVLIAFSGFAVDIELMVGASKTLSSLLPWTYGFDALRRTTLLGQPLLSLSDDLLVIAVAVVAFYVAAYFNFGLSRERLLT